MSTPAELETAVADSIDYVSTVGDDTRRWSKEQSAEFYESVGLHCAIAARALREEVE